MMNYQEMSGYEINTRLHNVIECDNRYDIKVDGYRVTWTDRVTGEESVTLRKRYDKSFKDYIGSWGNAGPIIEENRITFTSLLDFSAWDAISPFAGLEFRDSNPLRAAMVVFLMMKGGE